MDPFDTEAVRAVWERVNATREQQLAKMITGERQARDTYLRLAEQNPRWKTQFSRLAAEEGRHAQRLSALYDLLFGCEAGVAPGKGKRYTDLRQALRACYAEELHTAQNYQNAAVAFAAQQEFFEALAAEEKGHARILQEIAEALTGQPGKNTAQKQNRKASV